MDYNLQGTTISKHAIAQLRKRFKLDFAQLQRCKLKIISLPRSLKRSWRDSPMIVFSPKYNLCMRISAVDHVPCIMTVFRKDRKNSSRGS